MRTYMLLVLVAICATALEAQERVTPREWQPKLQSSVFDSNNDQIDDSLTTISATSTPATPLDLLLAMNRCPTEEDVRRIERFGDVTYVGRFVSFIQLQNVNRADLADLATDPAVAMVFPNRKVYPDLDVSTRAAKIRQSAIYPTETLDDVLPDDDNVGSIAIIDSGVDDGQHESIPLAMAGYDTFTRVESNPDDGFGHGTHVAGIALGTGGPNQTYRGVCRMCRLVDIKVFDNNGNGDEGNVARGIEKCIQRRRDWSIAVINLSLGARASSDGTDPLSQLVNRAVQEGIVVVASAGNNPPTQHISSPGAADEAITVANANDNHTIRRNDDTIAFDSVRGPRANDGDSLQDELKPEVAAHGSSIFSAIMNTTNLYLEKSGTSMAAPHVAGLAARLMAYRPHLLPGSLKRALSVSAEDFAPAGWDSAWGFGLINGHAAFGALSRPGADIGFVQYCGSAGSWWVSNDLVPANPQIVLNVPNEIRATITNSALSPLLNGEATVRLAFYRFGNSNYKFDICERAVPALAQGASVTISCPWRPTLPGHGCLKAEVIYPSDPEPRNNCVQHNVDIGISPVGIPIKFDAWVSNPTGKRIYVRTKDDFMAAGDWEFLVAPTDQNFILEPFECPRYVVITLTAMAVGVQDARVNIEFRAKFHPSEEQDFSIGGVTVVGQSQ